MKRFWLIGLLIANGLVGNAQAYHPFPTDSASWSEAIWIYSATDPSQTLSCNMSKHYGLAGDTFLFNESYAKLYGINHILTTAPAIYVSEFILDTASYIGGIREEDKRVYFLNAGDSIEYVVYDFNLVPGDVFWLRSPLYEDSMYAMVNDTPYVQLANGETRKSISFLSAVEIKWIEGIGGHVGWFDYEWFGTFVYGMCFSQDDSAVFSFGGGCVCSPSTGVDQIVTNFSLGPNPSTGNIFVSLPPNTERITVFNSLGQRVFQNQVIHQNPMTVDVSSLPNGVYYLMLNGPESSDRQTFVKQ